MRKKNLITEINKTRPKSKKSKLKDLTHLDLKEYCMNNRQEETALMKIITSKTGFTLKFSKEQIDYLIQESDLKKVYKYKNTLMLYLSSQESLNLYVENLDNLFDKTDLTHLDSMSHTALSYALFHAVKLSDKHWALLVNAILNPQFNNDKALANVIDLAKHKRDYSYFEIIWVYTDNKEWLYNYINEKSHESTKKFILESALMKEYAITREKEHLSQNIKNRSESLKIHKI